MTDISIGTSFVAGVVSFLSPCVLPLIPGYISYLSGLSLEEILSAEDPAAAKKKTLLGSLAFVLGFSLVFSALGASASAVGQFFSAHQALLSKAAGALVILFGLHTTGLLPLKWLYYEKRFHASPGGRGLLGAFLMGLAFAFGWTPCVGPILAGILALAATQESVSRGVLLLFVYSMGLGIPFLLTALALGSFLKFFQRYKRFIRWGEIFAGLLLIAVGAMIFTNRLTRLISLLPDVFLKFAL